MHIDQSEDGAVQILEDNISAPERERLLKTRWGIVNVWRPIKPIKKDPLAVCDAASVPDEDLMAVTAQLPPASTGTFENISKSKHQETWGVKAGKDQRWYYASEMTPNEALLIKCFDSRRDGKTARRSPHSAFEDPNAEGVQEPRESVEVRSLVFWEDQN